MGDVADPSVKSGKKKKTLAFLKAARKTQSTPHDDFEFRESGGNNKLEAKDDDDGLDMFKRSKDFWPQLTKKEDKEQDPPGETTPEPRASARAHKRNTEDSDGEPTPHSSRSSKRRRLSSPTPVADIPQGETWDELYGPATPPRCASTKSATPASYRKQSIPASDRSTKRVTRSTEKIKGKILLVQSDLITVDDEDEDALDQGNTPSSRKAKIESSVTKKRSASPIMLEDSDDELIDSASEPKTDRFAAWVEAARKRKAEAEARAAADDSASDNEGQTRLPAIKLFIHSRITGYDVGVLGCKRTIDQDLGPVKNAFVAWLNKKQGDVSKEIEADIFLTWRERRLYDGVSGMGMGWEVDAKGRLLSDRAEGFHKGGVELEAWTSEDYDRYVAEQARQKLVARGDLPQVDGAELEVEEEEDEQEKEPEVPKIRLWLAENNKEAMPLTAYADTQVRVLIGAYRRQKGVPDNVEIRLQWDGEWLDPLATVEQAEIEDKCTVDVYLK